MQAPYANNKHLLGNYGVVGIELSASHALSQFSLTSGATLAPFRGKQGTERVNQFPEGPQGAVGGIRNPQSVRVQSAPVFTSTLFITRACATAQDCTWCYASRTEKWLFRLLIAQG